GLAHGDDPVLTWMMSNVAVLTDPAENIKPAKNKSTERIDGVVALIMALARQMVLPPTAGSVYEERGIVTL
ncbi:MAG: terminase TerL endonuclease subunit, partial [Gammaproteobacteria bacterium]